MTGTKRNAYIAGVIFSIIVGFSFLGAKTALAAAGPLVTLAYRFDFALLAMVVCLAFRFVKLAFKKEKLRGLIVAAVTYCAFMAFQIMGLLFSTSVEGGILFAIIPIITMVMAEVFLKEKTSKLQKLFVMISVTGVIILLLFSSGVIHLGENDPSQGFSVSIPGITLLFISSCFLATSNVTVRSLRGRFAPIQISFAILVIGAFSFTIAALLQGIQTGQVQQYFHLITNVKFVLATAYLGVFSTFFSSVLINYMMAYLKAVQATLFGNLSTAISIVAGALIIHEPVYAYHVVCTVLIAAGVLGTSIAGERKRI